MKFLCSYTNYMFMFVCFSVHPHAFESSAPPDTAIKFQVICAHKICRKLASTGELTVNIAVVIKFKLVALCLFEKQAFRRGHLNCGCQVNIEVNFCIIAASGRLDESPLSRDELSYLSRRGYFICKLVVRRGNCSFDVGNCILLS